MGSPIVHYSFYVNRRYADELAPKDKIKIVARDLFTAFAMMCRDLHRYRDLAERDPVNTLKMLAGVAGKDIPLIRALTWLMDYRTIASEVLDWLSNWVCRERWYSAEQREEA